jgi:hypothetical protein
MSERYDRSVEWFDKTIRKGKKVGKNKKGVWRRVPGFPKKTILVSSKGWVQQWSAVQKSWQRPKRGHKTPAYYFQVKLRGHAYGVSTLVNRAHNGAPVNKTDTTDHIIKREDGDKEKERQDNCAKNLRWSDRFLQNANRTFSETPYSDDRPLEACSEQLRDGWTIGEWRWFQSQQKAANALGVSQGSLSHWLAGHHKCSTGWRVRWALPAETQDDLQATGYAPAHDLSEAWVEINSTLWVSNQGRAWRPYRKSKVWRKFTPRAMEDQQGYATVRTGSKLNKFHLVVFDAHYPGLRGDLTVDHINRDRNDNRLANLRLATRSDQVRNQTRMALGDGNMDSQKMRIRYRHVDASTDAPWEKCLGVSELARRLTNATGKIYHRPGIGNASHGRNQGTHKYNDYVFYKV